MHRLPRQARGSRTPVAALRLRLRQRPPDYERDDIWPDYPAPALLPEGDGARAVLGIYGFWPKFLQPERRSEAGKKLQPFSTHNSRAEEASVKRLYAPAWRGGHRCLLPASYVVEPEWSTGKNVWHRCGLTGWEPFAVAGLWKRYETPQGPVTGLTMLTGNADSHAVMRHMHRPNEEKRSVIILREQAWDEWLHTTNVEAARSLLQLLPADEMQAEPVPGTTRSLI
ncbi:SOS response-associated peptidase family protein [Paraburkholderia unamae]|uniref:SOS response-associated peptidase family protein n=1 Tax=Paraburkholderia unamae TaxID=219649 RepID=A0ACC6RXA6_9BURK